MKKSTFKLPLFASILFTVLIISCNSNGHVRMPKEEGEENDKKRMKYFELIHKTKPGDNWKAIEAKNSIMLMELQQQLLLQPAGGGAESFANGKLTGTWSERGSSNIAGNVKATDFDAATEALYLVSDGGTLWKGNINNGGWTVLNQAIRCAPNILRLTTNESAGKRILVAINNNIHYSDNEGKNFTPSAGIEFPVEWGGNYIASLVQVNDVSKSIYVLTRPWDPSPWSPRFWLYRSADLGKTFTRIYVFGFGDDGAVSLNIPVNANQLYMYDSKSTAGKGTMYSIDGDIVTKINTSGNIPGTGSCILKGYSDGTGLTQYVLRNNVDVYKTANQGAGWTKTGSLPESSWDRFEISNTNPGHLFAGGVDGYRSTNGGWVWNKINEWWEYYGNEATKLHADIMDIAFYKKQNGQSFMIITNHGGCYISYDDALTTTNISLSGLNTGQFYDVLSDQDNTNNIYTGTQDQGLQRNTTANTVNGPLEFEQVISGDYGYLTFSGSPKHLWTQYPGGVIDYYQNPNEYASNYWTMTGSTLPNYGWMLPVAEYNRANNEVLIAGGNLDGAEGSYLIKLKAMTTPPYSITPTQINYDFRANSNSGSAGITAIAVDNPANPQHIYAAAEDGTFFYSNDNGINWNKASSFEGPYPWWLYGSSIVVSKINPSTIWYAGSGYSNPAVYVSNDGGLTFRPIATGLPNTLVTEIITNPEETMLFAATESGPYVYIAAEEKWYPMMGAAVPLQHYTSVEYIVKENTVRFGTYGRGLWDFKIESALSSGLFSFTATVSNQDAKLQWSITSEQNLISCEIERSADAMHFNSIGSVKPSGSAAGTHRYNYTDVKITKYNSSVLYYRIKMTGKNGAVTYSSVIPVRLYGNDVIVTAWPNPAKDYLYTNLHLSGSADITVSLISAGGYVVYNKQYSCTIGNTNFVIPLQQLKSGTYFLSISGKGVKEIKQIIKTN